MGITLSYLYNGTLILELNLFWKTIQGAIYLKTESPLLPKRCGTDHTGINMKGLLIELRPKVLLDNRGIFPPMDSLAENWIVWEPRHLRNKVWLYFEEISFLLWGEHIGRLQRPASLFKRIVKWFKGENGNLGQSAGSGGWRKIHEFEMMLFSEIGKFRRGPHFKDLDLSLGIELKYYWDI